jgi:hypothetical protein
VESKIVGRTKEQFDSFMAGFDEIIPRALLRVFTPSELEVSLLAHLPTFDAQSDAFPSCLSGAHLWKL